MSHARAVLPARPQTASAHAGAVMVVAGLVCQEVGAALAVGLFPEIGAFGVVAFRLCVATAVLGVLARPRLRGLAAPAWRAIVAYGLAMAGLNVFFYLALERLALGVVVSIELLGPLVVSVVTAAARSGAFWALGATGGVLLLGFDPQVRFDPLGVIFALTAAACWAAYILAARRATTHVPGVAGAAVGMAVGAILVTPFAAATAGLAMLQPSVMLVGIGVALLSSCLPYALEILALRRMPVSTFSITLALAPVIAALAGVVLLGDDVGVLGWMGVLVVVASAAGALRTPHQGSGGDGETGPAAGGPRGRPEVASSGGDQTHTCSMAPIPEIDARTFSPRRR
ncbi:EamA family transporter [Microbacterium aquimaris]|uniref:EamA family transporter n=1 Tax=Microbacterium aquimaris TaxID=459816 RepID=UPI002AD27B28|nr:EamA family transporter [Microbacterium aquimaris]MDZ8274881.1 EamA family transporter [Microbacterium aquimaris]